MSRSQISIVNTRLQLSDKCKKIALLHDLTEVILFSLGLQMERSMIKSKAP